MSREVILGEYFEYLCQIACGEDDVTGISWSCLMYQLFDTPFRVSFIAMDENRIKNALGLRYAFADQNGYSEEIINDVMSEVECSVLEIMVDLSLRIENTIMVSSEYGDRTSNWFWTMIASLGLNGMTDDQYDPEYVDMVLDRFMDREYTTDGAGSLFYVPNTTKDLRMVEIWYQACEYLNRLIDEGRE